MASRATPGAFAQVLIRNILKGIYRQALFTNTSHYPCIASPIKTAKSEATDTYRETCLQVSKARPYCTKPGVLMSVNTSSAKSAVRALCWVHVSSGNSASSAINYLILKYNCEPITSDAISPGETTACKGNKLEQTSSFIAIDVNLQSPSSATISPGRCQGRRSQVQRDLSRCKPT